MKHRRATRQRLGARGCTSRALSTWKVLHARCPSAVAPCSAVQDVTTVTCPYCFEAIELYVDPDTTGEMVHDCDVCCRPWTVVVSRDADGALVVSVGRAQ